MDDTVVRKPCQMESLRATPDSTCSSEHWDSGPSGMKATLISTLLNTVFALWLQQEMADEEEEAKEVDEEAISAGCLWVCGASGTVLESCKED